MQTSIELFVLANFLFDAGILLIVSKCTGYVRFPRILLTAAGCTLYALIAAYRSSPWLSPVFQLMMLIPLSMLATGSADIRHWGRCVLMLCSCTFIAGGLFRYFKVVRSIRIAAFLSTLSGISILYALSVTKRRSRDCWTVELCIVSGGSSVRFPALIDTGNRLHEPLSGLPVIIVEADAIADILPESGYRVVAFGGLGGNGTLRCFRPDSVWIASGRKLKRMPDAWIGVSEIQLPGINSALAPGVYASL